MAKILTVTKKNREKLNGHKGIVIWLTGLSGSGKSTLANAINNELHNRAMHAYVLDGDVIRGGLNSDLSFDNENRIENIRRVAEVAKLMLDAGLIVIVALISPFVKDRQFARSLIGSSSFMEIYISTPLEICEARDVKGLYKKARAGLIKDMTGIDSPYEPPDNPDLEFDTTKLAECTIVNEMINKIMLRVSCRRI